MLSKGTITVNNTAAVDADANHADKKVTFENCAPFTDWKSEINNLEIDDAKDIDIVMPMYNLTEYGDNYSKTSGSLWQYGKDIPDVYNNGKTVDFAEDDATDSFDFKEKITVQTGNDGTKGVQIMVPLKYFSNFWRTLETPLVNCEINPILSWSENGVIVTTNNANQGATFAIIETKLYKQDFLFYHLKMIHKEEVTKGIVQT